MQGPEGTLMVMHAIELTLNRSCNRLEFQVEAWCEANWTLWILCNEVSFDIIQHN